MALIAGATSPPSIGSSFFGLRPMEIYFFQNESDTGD